MASITNLVTSSNTLTLIGTAVGTLIIGKGLYEIFHKYRPQSPKDQPFPFVPVTISPEAQEYLRTATPVGGPVQDLEVWKLIRDGFRNATISTSDKMKEKYIEATNLIKIGTVPVFEITPKNYQSRDDESILIYIHGGAFTLGSPEHLYQIFAPVAFKTGMITYAIDYRLAPEHPFPCGLEDCVNVYTQLLKKHKPENIFFLGDSAGANLCIATILQSRDANLPLPKAVGLNSPVVDVDKNSDTFFTLAGRSPKLSYEKSIDPSLRVYIEEKKRQNPFVSVLNGDFKKGFPPVTIHTGTRDLLLSECARLDRKLKESNIDSSLEVWEGLWHGFQEHEIPEADQSTSSMAEFFKKHMNKSIR